MTDTIDAPAKPVETRIGDWMITYTGRRFYPLDPRVSEVDWRDIAHSLAFTCRYGGHVRRFYSVAEHCAILAGYFLRLGKPDLAKWALLHDAAEAYVGDIIRPLKPSLDGFAQVEADVEFVIFERAGLIAPGAEWDGKLPAEVKDADNRIIADEARALFGPDQIRSADWRLTMEPLGVQVGAMHPDAAERHFISIFRVLFGDPRD